MKISKKAASELGTKMAHELHRWQTPATRTGVNIARLEIGDMLWNPLEGTGSRDVWRAYQDAFNETINKLEPLSDAA